MEKRRRRLTIRPGNGAEEDVEPAVVVVVEPCGGPATGQRVIEAELLRRVDQLLLGLVVDVELGRRTARAGVRSDQHQKVAISVVVEVRPGGPVLVTPNSDRRRRAHQDLGRHVFEFPIFLILEQNRPLVMIADE